MTKKITRKRKASPSLDPAKDDVITLSAGVALRQEDKDTLAAAGVVGEHPAFVIVCVSEKGSAKPQWAGFERVLYKADATRATGQIYKRLTAPKDSAAAVAIVLTEVLTNRGV